MRVYAAGAISASHPLVFLENLRKGMRLSAELILNGHSVFSPFIDFQLFFALHDGETITSNDIKDSSLDWLEVADAVVLVPGWEDSEGTKAEINLANELGIPVYQDLETFLKFTSEEVECDD